MRRKGILAVSTVIVGTAAVLALAPRQSSSGPGAQGGPRAQPVPPGAAEQRAPQPMANVVEPVTAERAQEANAALPFATGTIEAALPLIDSNLLRQGPAGDPSIGCLTAAVYYEAGGESLQGERAVAQVVLNRVRHPSFPKSVCAVVYQGADRATGCQFTFTCDGSLARRPDPRLWRRAALVAEEALRGRVEPSVGLATHYHADYVFPYWAPTLRKIVKVGNHIFYGWRGDWGRRIAFTQLPIWAAQAPSLPLAPDRAGDAALANVSLGAPQTLSSRLRADYAVGTPPPITNPATDRPSRIMADDAAGTLLVDARRAAPAAESTPSASRAADVKR